MSQEPVSDSQPPREEQEEKNVEQVQGGDAASPNNSNTNASAADETINNNNNANGNNGSNTNYDNADKKSGVQDEAIVVVEVKKGSDTPLKSPSTNPESPASPGKKTQAHKEQKPLPEILQPRDSRNPGFWAQFGTLQKKNFLQKKRMPIGCCLELTLPILFVLGLVGAWSAAEVTVNPPTHYVLEDYATEFKLGGNDPITMLKNMVCTNNTEQGWTIPGVMNCSMALMGHAYYTQTPLRHRSNLSCITHTPNGELGGGIPFDGLCWVSDALIPNATITPMEALRLALAWDQSAPRVVYTFDEFVLIRWFSRGLTGAKHIGFVEYLFPDNGLSRGSLVYFTPDDNRTTRLINYLNTTTSLFKYVYGGTFADEGAGLAKLLSIELEGRAWTWLHTRDKEIDGDLGLDIEIKQNKSDIPWPHRLRERFSTGPGSGYHRHYWTTGFLTLMRTCQEFSLTTFYNQTAQSIAANVPEFQSQMMPWSEYRDSEFLIVAGGLCPLALCFAYLYTVSQLVKRIVEEKEFRIREAMLIMGLHKGAFYFSWVTSYMIQNLFGAFFMTVILKATILSQGDATLLFVVLMIFSFSTVTFASMLSSFFSKSRVSAMMAPLIFFAASVPTFTMDPEETSREVFLVISLLSPCAFGTVTRSLFSYERARGAGWQDMANPDDKVMLWEGIVFMLADFVLYFLLGVYFDCVLPSEWGTQLSPLPCFWCAKEDSGEEDMETDLYESEAFSGTNDVDNSSTTHNPIAGQDQNSPMPTGKSPNDNNENASPTSASPSRAREMNMRRSKDASVKIRNLTKEFEIDGTTKTAVNKFCLDMFQDEVTVLLGHNGAGKTTTINMLTGMLPVSSGDCSINGMSIRTQMKEVRNNVGICPQHNILWNELTVREHLEVFAGLKGYSSEEREEAATAMVQACDLGDFEYTFAGGLSGGNKRKLSVACSFIGGAKLVFLDEPSAGMDVVARRHTWDLIDRMSPGRTIVLTTHYMDEADLLGSQIAIMNHGEIFCSGSPLYLKTNMGAGYSLTVQLDSVAGGCVVQTHEHVLEFVQSVTHCEVISSRPGEVVLRLPSEAVSLFPAILGPLEGPTGKAWGVRALNISVTTLEEVFLRISESSSKKEAEERLGISAGNKQNCIEESKEKKSAPANGEVAPEVAPVVANSPAPEPQENHSDVSSIAMPDEEKGSEPPSPVKNEEKKGEAEPVDNTTVVHPFEEEQAGGNEEEHEDSLWPPGVSHHRETTFGRQFAALMAKRFHNAKRDRKTQCLQIVTPILCILLAMWLAQIQVAFTPSREFHPSMWEAQTNVVVDQSCGSDVAPYMNKEWYVLDEPNIAQSFPYGNSSYNLSQYLLSTYDTHTLDRFWAVACKMEGEKNRTVFLTNSTARHGAAEAMQQLLVAYGKKLTGDDNYRLVMRNNQIPFTDRESMQLDALITLIVAFFLLIPFTFIPATFVAWAVKEKELKAKHLQMISGVKFSAYWFANLAFDLMSMFMTQALMYIIFFIFQRGEYIGTAQNFGACFLLFTLYALSCIAGAYVLSFAFESHGQAMNVVMLANFVAGFMCVILIYFLSIIESTEEVAKVLKYFFRVIPAYSLGEGILAMATAEVTRAFLNAEVNPLELEYCGWAIIYLAIEFPVFMALTLFLDHPARVRAEQALLHNPDTIPDPVQDEDEDVAEERRIVESGVDRKELVRVKNLCKKFDTPAGTRVAIQNLSFGVVPGEIFAFLGTNGAGKTTTMNVLTGSMMPTHGYGYVKGIDVVEHGEAARENVGYCPQFDALLDLLTPEEHLHLFATLRGVEASGVTKVVEHLMALCHLTEYRNIPASSLSGGNKRKLSVAIALVGAPPVLFLDEPSAGMDPATRRKLWSVIQRAAKKSAVILTTHHLEEVEVLGDRVAIMVAGALRCIGTLSHLKTTFGGGLEVVVKMRDEERTEEMVEWLIDVFNINPKASACENGETDAEFEPSVKLLENRQGRCTFSLATGLEKKLKSGNASPEAGAVREGEESEDNAEKLKLASIFQQFMDNSEKLGIQDYSVSQGSLESVFLRISEENSFDAPPE